MSDFDVFGDMPAPAPAPANDPAAEFLANQQQKLAGLMDDDFDGFGSSLPTNSTLPQQDHFSGEQSADTGDFFTSNQDNQLKTQHFGLGDESAQETSPEQPADANLAAKKIEIYSAMREEMNESDKLRQWRAAQRDRLAKKDADEDCRRKECYASAKRELDDWYKHYGDQINKTRAANRDMEKMLIAERGEPLAVGSESQTVIWDRICRLCDFNPKNVKFQKDITQFRSLLLQLKQTPPIRT